MPLNDQKKGGGSRQAATAAISGCGFDVARQMGVVERRLPCRLSSWDVLDTRHGARKTETLGVKSSGQRNSSRYGIKAESSQRQANQCQQQWRSRSASSRNDSSAYSSGGEDRKK